jgi:hypothetical protein
MRPTLLCFATGIAASLVGCGASPTTDPVADRPAGNDGGGGDSTTDSRLFSPGLYTGDNTCRIVATAGGESVSWVQTNPDSLLIGTDGMPPGFAPGQPHTVDRGLFSQDFQITSVEQAANGLRITAAASMNFRCANSCRYALDRVCDEPTYCELGTDCTDCGQLVLDGSQTLVFRRAGDDEIATTGTSNANDVDGLIVLNITCSGTLVK